MTDHEELGLELVAFLLARSHASAVWRFEDAPDFLQDLSTAGGDEDHVALVPEGVEEPDAFQAGTAFARCDVERICFRGFRILIGSHA